MSSLAYLHSAGFTHLDLKKLFATSENYDEVWDGFVAGK